MSWVSFPGVDKGHRGTNSFESKSSIVECQNCSACASRREVAHSATLLHVQPTLHEALASCTTPVGKEAAGYRARIFSCSKFLSGSRGDNPAGCIAHRSLHPCTNATTIRRTAAVGDQPFASHKRARWYRKLRSAARGITFPKEECVQANRGWRSFAAAAAVRSSPRRRFTSVGVLP